MTEIGEVTIVQVGGVELKISNHGVQKDSGNIIPLHPNEIKFLRFLIEKRGTVVTPGMLLNHLYSGGDQPEIKIFDVLACKLRKSIGILEVAKSIWGRGFRFGEPMRVRIPIVSLSVGDELWEQIFMATSRKFSSVKDLPHYEKGRWVPSRKALIILLLRHRALTTDQLLGHYPDLSLAELGDWERLYCRNGMAGLRTTRTQTYLPSSAQ